MSSSPSPTCEFSSPSPPASIIEVRCHESRCHCIKRDKITTSMPDEYFSEYFLSGWHSRVSCRLLLMTQTITALGSFRQSCLMPSNRDLSAYSSDKSDFNFFFLTSVETKCHVCPSIYRQKGKLRARRHTKIRLEIRPPSRPVLVRWVVFIISHYHNVIHIVDCIFVAFVILYFKLGRSSPVLRKMIDNMTSKYSSQWCFPVFKSVVIILAPNSSPQTLSWYRSRNVCSDVSRPPRILSEMRLL